MKNESLSSSAPFVWEPLEASFLLSVQGHRGSKRFYRRNCTTLLSLPKKRTIQPPVGGTIQPNGCEGKNRLWKVITVLWCSLSLLFVSIYTCNPSSLGSVCHFNLPSVCMPTGASYLHPAWVLFIIKVAWALPSINPSARLILPNYECNLQAQRCSALSWVEAVKLR